MNIWGIVFIIIGIIVVVAVYQQGWENFKSSWFQSSIDSTKTIYDTGKNIVDYATQENSTDSTELIEVGMIPCKTNEDCESLEECKDGACQCYSDGICYIEE